VELSAKWALIVGVFDEGQRRIGSTDPIAPGSKWTLTLSSAGGGQTGCRRSLKLLFQEVADLLQLAQYSVALLARERCRRRDR
jgi:hypothetical protein